MNENDQAFALKLMMAKLAYRDIQAVVEKYEHDYNVIFNCHWERRITIDGTTFEGYTLRKPEDQ